MVPSAHRCHCHLLERSLWLSGPAWMCWSCSPGRAMRPSPSTTQPRLYLVDGQLLAASPPVAVVWLSCAHPHTGPPHCLALISTEGCVQSSIREGWKRERSCQRVSDGGDTRRSRQVFRDKQSFFERERGSGTRFSNHSCCKNKHNLVERVHWLPHTITIHHLPFSPHQFHKQGHTIMSSGTQDPSSWIRFKITYQCIRYRWYTLPYFIHGIKPLKMLLLNICISKERYSI